MNAVHAATPLRTSAGTGTPAGESPGKSAVRFARHLDGGGGGRSDGDPLIRASIDSGPSEPGDDDVQVWRCDADSSTKQGFAEGMAF